MTLLNHVQNNITIPLKNPVISYNQISDNIFIQLVSLNQGPNNAHMVLFVNTYL